MARCAWHHLEARTEPGTYLHGRSSDSEATHRNIHTVECLDHAVAPFAITYDMQILLQRPSDGWRKWDGLGLPAGSHAEAAWTAERALIHTESSM